MHGAVVESERVCRDRAVALGITQLLTDPDVLEGSRHLVSLAEVEALLLVVPDKNHLPSPLALFFYFPVLVGDTRFKGRFRLL